MLAFLNKFRQKIASKKTLKVRRHYLKLYVYLENSEVGFSGKGDLLAVTGISIVAVIVQPLLQDLDRLLGQVAATFS